MTLKRSDLVDALAERITTDFFLTMLNPSLRAANFRYSVFNIEGWVQDRMDSNLPSAPSTKELARAAVIAGKTWRRLIARVGDGIPEEVR